jgi:hypothetical protein
MLKLLKRWLGWEADSGPFDFGDLQIPFRNRSKPAAGTQPDKPRAPQTQSQPQPDAGQRTAPPKPTKKRSPMDVLDNPLLTLDKPGQDGFDPYNTGAFNRSASWEKIGRQKKR